MKNRRAAMEMSVGTIVTIVLLMSVLILGIFLVQKIFSSAKGAIDLTDEQLKNEINKLFADDKEITIYPQTRQVEISPGGSDAIGIGITNLLRGVEGEQKFSYEVTLEDEGDCGANAESWLKLGKKADNFGIGPKDTYVRRVILEVPEGAPLCSARYAVSVTNEGKNYAGDYFDIRVN